MMKFSLLLLASLLVTPLAQAQTKPAPATQIKVSHAVARSTSPVQRNGVAYLHLENLTSHADTLLAVSSPVANSVEIHTMSMAGDVMQMRAVDKLELAAGSKLEMHPGAGHHVMLIGLKAALSVGGKFPLVLQFEKAGKVVVEVKVDAWLKTKPETKAHAGHAGHAHHGH